MRPDQVLWAYQWFEIEEDGNWFYERAYKEAAKGDGKTMLLAAIGLFELFGPLAPSYPNIPVAAAGQDQSMQDGIFKRIKQILEDPKCPLGKFAKIGYDVIERRDRPGQIRAIPANGTTTDGGLPTLFLADEVQDWFHSAADAHERNENSATKRENPKGRSISASTPGEYAGDGSVGWRLHNYGTQCHNGVIDDPRFLFDSHAADDKWDLSDPVQLEQAIRQANVGASDKKVERLMRRYKEIPEHRFRRFHLGQWVVSDGKRWMDVEAFSELADYERVVAPGEEIFLAFDGSISDDATGLLAMTPDGFMFPIKCWERPEVTPRWTVPKGEVDAKVQETFQTYKVIAMGCDPSAGWLSNVQKWAESFGEKVVLEIPPTDKRMAPAAETFLADVLNKQISHNGDALLFDHVRNCVPKQTTSGVTVRKEHYDSPRKIDLAVCGIMANDLRHRFGDQAKKKRSKKLVSF